MSLLPFVMDFVDDPLEDAFGYALYPEQFFQPRLRRYPGWTNLTSWPQIYNRQWAAPQRNELINQAANLSKSVIGKDGFQVCMDVQHFQPNEITVKTIDNSVVVEGKHEEKEDAHGRIYRHFVRRYDLPKEIDVKDVASSISSDGVLTIKAPPKVDAIESKERIIPVQQTGPAYLSVKSNEAEKKGKEAGEKMTE